MQAKWTTSYAELPLDGQLVEFVLGGRETVMFGTYVQQIFQSRWTGYDIDRVRIWRPADLNSSVSSPMAKAGFELPTGLQALRDVA